MKKYLWMLLIVSVLLACTLTVFGASDTGTVVYLDPNVSASGDGTSPGTAVKTLAEAYTKLNGGDGTIVLCDDLSLTSNKLDATAGSEFSAKTGNVKITGKDPKNANDTTYPVINIATASDAARYVEIFTPTEFTYLTINKTNTKALYFVTGHSLTFGEGVEFTDNGAALGDAA